MCASTLVIYMINYKQIEIGDIVIDTYMHGGMKSHNLILEQLDDGLYKVYCIQAEEEVIVDYKFDSHMQGTKYEIIKPNK